MKKIALIISLSGLFFGPAKAQVTDLNSFYQRGAIWATYTYEYYQLGTPRDAYFPRKYEISHDSIIGGQTVHLVTFEDRTTRKFIGAIRVDGQKVYFQNLSPDSIYVRWRYLAADNNPSTTFGPNTEHLLYDYNIRLGDTLRWKAGFQVVVRIDSVLADSVYLRRFHFYYVGATTNAYGQEYWIKGIGSNLGFFGSCDTPYAILYNPKGYTRISRYCSPERHYNFGMYDGGLYDGNCYSNSLNISHSLPVTTRVSVFPNPGNTGEIHITTAGGAGLADVTIYDLYGRPVFHSLPLHGSATAVMHAELPPAVYFMKIVLSNDVVIVRRYIRQ